MVTPLAFGLQYERGQHRGPKPPAYCRSCGRAMRITTWSDGYDATTGALIMRRYAKCPAPWWDLRIHDRAVEDEHHDWPWL